MIYHVARRSDWEEALTTGEYSRSTLDRSLVEEGFIHASHRDQVQGVLDRYCRGVDEPLVLLAIDPTRLGCEVRHEAAPGGELFPHIYGPLPVGAVAAVTEVEAGGDGGTAQAGSIR